MVANLKGLAFVKVYTYMQKMEVFNLLDRKGVKLIGKIQTELST